MKFKPALNEENSDIGSAEYSYTVEQVEYLRDCILANPGRLASALQSFFFSFDPLPGTMEVLGFWLFKVEQIQDDPELKFLHEPPQFCRISKCDK